MNLFINGGIFSTGKTPLFVAVERDHYNFVALLIDVGADQDIPDFKLNKPIHVIQSERIASLLEYNDKTNASGLTAIESVIKNQRIEVIEVFIDNTKMSLEKLFFAATVSNSSKVISFLFNNLTLVDFNHVTNEKGNDLMMQAVGNGSYEVFKFLIAKKFSIDYRRRNIDNENITDISKRIVNVGIFRYLEKEFKNKLLS